MQPTTFQRIGSTTLATVNGSNGTIPAGQFAPVTLTYTTGGTVASGNISIQLTSGGQQIDFDKVSLTYNSGTPSVTYYLQDQLSNRLATDVNGNLPGRVVNAHDYMRVRLPRLTLKLCNTRDMPLRGGLFESTPPLGS